MQCSHLQDLSILNKHPSYKKSHTSPSKAKIWPKYYHRIWTSSIFQPLQRRNISRLIFVFRFPPDVCTLSFQLIYFFISLDLTNQIYSESQWHALRSSTSMFLLARICFLKCHPIHSMPSYLLIKSKHRECLSEDFLSGIRTPYPFLLSIQSTDSWSFSS